MKTLKIFLLLSLVTTYPSFTQTWEFVGLDSLVVKQVYVSGDTIWAGTDARINPNMIAGLYKSTDGGNSWNQIDSTLGDGTAVYFYKNLNNSIYYLVKGTGSYNIAGYLYKSTDQGKNWDIIQQLENIAIDWIGISSFNENEIYVKQSNFIQSGWFETVYRTIDAGTNWEEITSGFPASSHGRRMSFNLSLTDSSTLYAPVNDNIGGTYFFKSTDKGDNWFFVSTPPVGTAETRTDLFLPGRIYLFAQYKATDDGGFNWYDFDSGLPNRQNYLSFYMNANYPNKLFNLRRDGLFVTMNDSINWQLIEDSEILPLNIGSGGFNFDDVGQMTNIFIDIESNQFYVGTAQGIYKTNLITNIQEEINNAGFDFHLEQNYPNPFNPATTIEYQVKNRAFILLKVYDILGNEIITLVSEEQPAGNYEITFNIGIIRNYNFTSGVYIYQIQAGTYVSSRKMIYLK